MHRRLPLSRRAGRLLGAAGYASATVAAVLLAAGGLGMATAAGGEDAVRAAARAPVRAAASLPSPPPGPSGKPLAPPRARIDPEARQALVYVGEDGERITAARIADYLESQGSPLAAYAEDFVAAGVRHDVDPRVVIGIAAAESSLGTRVRGHNAWGWGAATIDAMVRWPDWPSAIDGYTDSLGDNYDTDAVDEDFAQRYCPPNWRWWIDTVRGVMADI